MPTASTGRTPTEVAVAPPPSPERLAANLRAIARERPDLAETIANTPADETIEFSVTPNGSLTATRDGRALASKRRPREEGARIAEALDAREHAVFVVMGFALGHHVRAIAEKVGRAGIVCVFEPDLALLRAVLERIDCTAWIGQTTLILFSDPDDISAISRAAHQREAIFGLGVRFVEHGPSAVRLGERAARFSDAFASAVAAVRTSVVTTMVQTQVTVRNALMNAEHYVARTGSSENGIRDLEGLCPGSPAIVVSAGPSLRRNIHLLRDPSVREKCVIICVQTALKTLLAEGITPHFVCALDYHEISKRFYEGLTPADVENVTLVAEAKVNPAVLDAYPGPVRMPADPTLDLLLPPALAGDHGRIQAGSTVAHLCYYLARHLGCDPVILTGQDLAFTDGVYYGEGAAIHDVWAAELGPFRTLEMMEWERIARSKRSLRAVKDADGNRLYTDEQMATYRVQFERAFAQDNERGLHVIDASEGGSHKNHSDAMTLRDALDRYAGCDAPILPKITTPECSAPSIEQRKTLDTRLAEVRRQAGRVELLCQRSERLLAQLRDMGGDQQRMAPVIDELHTLRDETQKLIPGYELVQRVNQTGAFNRARADRDIHLEDLSPVEQQARKIERDATNVRWLGEAAGECARLLDAARDALDGGAKLTGSAAAQTPDDVAPTEACAAVLFIDPDFDSLGRPRALDGAKLRAVLEQINACETLDRVVLASDDPARWQATTVDAPHGLRIDHSKFNLSELRAARRRVAAARAWAPDAWRGGLGGLSVYDELFESRSLADLMREHAIDAAVLIGDDWSELDPSITDQIVRRRNENTEQHRVVFTQAPPGRAGVVVNRALADELAGASGGAKRWASLGGILGYMPFNPLADPIGRALCVNVEPSVRDAPVRNDAAAPGHIIIELTTRSAISGGERATWWDADSGDNELDAGAWDDLLAALAEVFPHSSISFSGRGDPLCSAHWRRVIKRARDVGIRNVHIRTDPLHGPETLGEAASIADVLSLDLLANSRDVYSAMTGADRFDEAVTAINSLLSEHDPAALGWIAPRMTRCATAWRDIEGFYDRWLMAAGAAVIDPLPTHVQNGSFAPLTLPRVARRRFAAQTLIISCDGAVMNGVDDRSPGRAVGNACDEDLKQLWRRVLEVRDYA